MRCIAYRKVPNCLPQKCENEQTHPEIPLCVTHLAQDSVQQMLKLPGFFHVLKSATNTASYAICQIPQNYNTYEYLLDIIEACETLEYPPKMLIQIVTLQFKPDIEASKMEVVKHIIISRYEIDSKNSDSYLG